MLAENIENQRKEVKMLDDVLAGLRVSIKVANKELSQITNEKNKILGSFNDILKTAKTNQEQLNDQSVNTLKSINKKQDEFENKINNFIKEKDFYDTKFNILKAEEKEITLNIKNLSKDLKDLKENFIKIKKDKADTIRNTGNILVDLNQQVSETKKVLNEVERKLYSSRQELEITNEDIKQRKKTILEQEIRTSNNYSNAKNVAIKTKQMYENSR